VPKSALKPLLASYDCQEADLAMSLALEVSPTACFVPARVARQRLEQQRPGAIVAGEWDAHSGKSRSSTGR
jgi:hypothetical protein